MPVQLPAGPCEIAVRVLPLSTVAVPRKPRARWLSPLVPDRSVRWRRTPLIGHIDWPGARPVLGPWGGLTAFAVPHDEDRPGVELPPQAVRTRVNSQGHGVVAVDLRGSTVEAAGVAQQTVRLSCAGASAEHTLTAAHHNGGVITVELTVPQPRRWWPHGMGDPALHELRVSVGDTVSVHRVGFRTVAARARAERAGLGLLVNGEPVFARGAVWAGADPFEAAADPATLRNLLLRLRAAGTTEA